MTNYYFTDKGAWGELEGVKLEVGDNYIIVPTSSWTKQMFKALDDSTNAERKDLAKHFNINVHRIFTGKCQICKLPSGALLGQHLVSKDDE